VHSATRRRGGSETTFDELNYDKLTQPDQGEDQGTGEKKKWIEKINNHKETRRRTGRDITVWGTTRGGETDQGI